MSDPTICAIPTNGPGLLSLEQILGMAKEIPDEPGVYFLIEENKIVYIGQSISPMVRVGNHLGDKTIYRKYFTHVAILPVNEKDLYAVESAYIEHYRPKHNLRLNGRPVHDTKFAKGWIAKKRELAEAAERARELRAAA